MAEQSEIEDRVGKARSIIRGNGALNIEQNMIYLATHELDLLTTIEHQCLTNSEDHSFWKQELCEPIQKRTQTRTADFQIAYLKACALILHASRKHLRWHAGNPAWAAKEAVRNAVRRCNEGNLDRTYALLCAALYISIVSEHTIRNTDGQNNELIQYVAEHLSAVEELMSWLEPDHLSVPFLESYFNKITHSTLNGGWL